MREKQEIEKAFGDSLEWERKDDLFHSRIRKTIPGAGLVDEDKWDEIQEHMIDAMIRLDKAFQKRISNLEL